MDISQAPVHHQHRLLLATVIVAAKKRETFLPVRSPVSVHLIVNIQRNDQSTTILQVLAAAAAAAAAAAGNTEKKTSLGLSMMLIVMVSVNCARHTEKHPLNEQVVYGQQGHSPTGRKLLRNEGSCKQ